MPIIVTSNLDDSNAIHGSKINLNQYSHGILLKSVALLIYVFPTSPFFYVDLNPI